MPADTAAKPFRFKQFTIEQDRCAMKVGTDGVLLGAWADVARAERILDVGTGTGVIAIQMAQRTDDGVQIDAVEIDEDSYEQALENVDRCVWSERVSIHRGSIQDFAKRTRSTTYDLIVCNPPFFSGGVLSDNHSRNVVRHTVKLPHGDLLMAVKKLLSRDGRFCVILPRMEGLRFREMSAQYGLHCTRTTEVRSRSEKPVERLLLQFERTERDEQRDQVVIQKSDVRNDWTDDYLALTGEFYLEG